MVAALNDDDRKRRARRTAVWLALLACAVYIGFITLAVMKGS